MQVVEHSTGSEQVVRSQNKDGSDCSVSLFCFDFVFNFESYIVNRLFTVTSRGRYWITFIAR